MKILYVDLKYDYGKVSRGLNQIGEVGFHQVFKKLGHEVIPFYYDEYLNNLGSLQTKVLESAALAKPDLIFFCLFTDQFYPETLLKLKTLYKTMNWFGDDHWRFEKFTSKYAPLFTYSITTDYFSISRYSNIGVENVILSQWAALNLPYTNEYKIRYQYDVSFVGGAHAVRKWFISEFAKAGIRVATFGHGWDRGLLSLEEMAEVFRTTKINLNLSNSVNYDVRFLTHSFKNILITLKSAKNVGQVKARNFEIPYLGGFQLTDYVPSIERYFDIGHEIVCYSNIDEAIALTQFYLKNDDLREQIKNAAALKARQTHTYLHRFQEIFSSI